MFNLIDLSIMAKYIVPIAFGVGGIAIASLYLYRNSNNKEREEREKLEKRKKKLLSKKFFYETVSNREQFDIMKNDLENYPENSYKGEYRNYEWAMSRPSSTYWCGYIGISDDDFDKLTEKQLDKINEIAHGGLTCGIGIDCAHYNDYYVGKYLGEIHKNGTYKTYGYVLNNIKEIIDYLHDIGFEGNSITSQEETDLNESEDENQCKEECKGECKEEREKECEDESDESSTQVIEHFASTN